jgi:hypothetical protein
MSTQQFTSGADDQAKEIRRNNSTSQLERIALQFEGKELFHEAS